MAPCSITIVLCEQLKRMLWMDEYSRDLSLRWVSDGYPLLQLAVHDGDLLMTMRIKDVTKHRPLHLFFREPITANNNEYTKAASLALYEGDPPVTYPSQRFSNAESVSMWRRQQANFHQLRKVRPRQVFHVKELANVQRISRSDRSKEESVQCFTLSLWNLTGVSATAVVWAPRLWNSLLTHWPLGDFNEISHK